MRLFKPYSKFIPGVLLILLFILVLLVFKSFHNALLDAGSKATSGWGIFLLIVVAIIGITYYIITLGLINRSNSLEKEISVLVQSNEEAKIQKEEKKETVTKEKLDLEKESKAIIPSTIDDLEKFGEQFLQNCAKRFNVVQGLLYLKDPNDGVFTFRAGYAYFSENKPVTYCEGETLAGQVAKNKTVLNLAKVPENYISVMSGLGEGSPKHLLIFPIIKQNNDTIGIVELASFKPFNNEAEELFAYIGKKLGEKLEQTSIT